MKGTKVASRYAQSLLELAIEQNELDATYNDISLIYNTCVGARDFSLFLKSPIIKPDLKRETINKIFEGKVSKLTSAFVGLLVKKGREGILEAVAKSFIDQYKVHKNILTAEVTSVIEFDSDLNNRFATALKDSTGKEIELNNAIDKDLIGGFILRMDDKQLDNSIKTQLKNIKKELLKPNASYINN